MKILRFCQQTISFCFIVAVLCVPVLDSPWIPGVGKSVALNAIDAPVNTLNAAALGFHLSGRYILDANGTEFIMRGVNHPHTWFLDKTSAFAHIKAKRANAVRVVLSSGNRPGWTKNSAADVTNVISICKANRLI